MLFASNNTILNSGSHFRSDACARTVIQTIHFRDQNTSRIITLSTFKILKFESSLKSSENKLCTTVHLTNLLSADILDHLSSIWNGPIQSCSRLLQLRTTPPGWRPRSGGSARSDGNPPDRGRQADRNGQSQRFPSPMIHANAILNSQRGPRP